MSLILDEIVDGGIGVSFDDIAGLEVGNYKRLDIKLLLHIFKKNKSCCVLYLVSKTSFARDCDSPILKT